MAQALNKTLGETIERVASVATNGSKFHPTGSNAQKKVLKPTPYTLHPAP